MCASRSTPPTGKASARKHIDVDLAKAYTAELVKLAKQLKLAGEVTLDQVLRAPGVFQTDEQLAESEDLWPAVEKALNQGLAALLKMREREGAHLAKDLALRIGVMQKAVAQIQKQAPATAENYRRNLLERIKTAGLENIAPDDERLLEGDRAVCRPLGHHRGIDASAKPFHAVRRLLQIQGAGGAHAGLPGAGNEPRNQHHRLQGE